MHHHNPVIAVTSPSSLSLLTPGKAAMALALEFDLGWGAGGRIGHRAWEGGDEGSRHVRECPQSQVANTVWQLKDDHVEGHCLLAGMADYG